MWINQFYSINTLLVDIWVAPTWSGIEYDGRCLTAATYAEECVIEPPAPPAPGDPGAPATPTATPDPAEWCDDNLANALSWRISLTD